MTDRESGEAPDPEAADAPEAPEAAEGRGLSSDDARATDDVPAPMEAFDAPDEADHDARPEAGARPEPDVPPPTDGATADDSPGDATSPAALESMTDLESGRAEAEASAEAAIDDGRGTALPGDDDERDPALGLAALHLRLGSLALARSELETFAGRGVLDASARIDLAEVRWRTGDLVGGGEAAREALAGGGEAVVALLVAAEAASALGRPSEARRLAGRAMSLNGGPIDGIFAGMPRSSVWPADPAEPLPSPSTLFPAERSDLAIESEREETALVAAVDREPVTATEKAASAESADPGLWDLHEAASVSAGTAQPVPSDLDPSALFDAGRAALENGDRASAAVHLGLVVRMAPALAPAVLSLIGEPNESGLQLVQGDAYRAVGHETEARRSYAAAIASASTPSTPSTVEWFEAASTAEPRAPAWWLESLDESRPASAWPPAAPAPSESVPGPAEPEQAEPDPVPEPAEPEPLAESAESDAANDGFEPREPEPEPGPRDDEGGWRVDDEEWRSDG